MYKFLLSFSALSLILASSPSFSMEFNQDLPEEQRVKNIKRSLQDVITVELDQTYTCENHTGEVITFEKGEVPGDGNCMFSSLAVLFPEKGITRAEFARRLNLAVNKPGLESEKIKEDLAWELNYYITNQYGSAGLDIKKLNLFFAPSNPNLEFKGNNIQNLIPRFDFSFSDEGQYNNINLIKNNNNVITEIIDSLAQDGVLLSLADNTQIPDLLGSFGLACKFFELDIDVYSPASVLGKAHGKEKNLFTNKLIQRSKIRFGKSSYGNAYMPALFLHGHHSSPLCDIRDLRMRERFAKKTLLMIENGEGSYRNVDAYQRAALIGKPVKEDKNITSTDNIISKKSGNNTNISIIEDTVEDSAIIKGLVEDMTQKVHSASDKKQQIAELEAYAGFLTDEVYVRYTKALNLVKAQLDRDAEAAKKMNIKSPQAPSQDVNKRQEGFRSPVANSIDWQHPDGISVKTDFSQGHYQIMSDLIPVTNPSTFAIDFKVDLKVGGFGIGLLTGDEQSWIIHRPFDKIGITQGTLGLPITSKDQNVKLVFTNHLPAAGISEFIINSLSIDGVSKVSANKTAPNQVIDNGRIVPDLIEKMTIDIRNSSNRQAYIEKLEAQLKTLEGQEYDNFSTALAVARFEFGY